MKEEIRNKNVEAVLKKVGIIADSLGVECYVVGGFVRDLLLGKDNDDIDFVVVGSGMELARELAKENDTEACIYESYGTAKVTVDGYELEFVGARKEFYHRESRNPIVEDGTLEDDIMRRDFTINSMAICVNANRFGEFIDMNGGKGDLAMGVVRCVGDATERFSEDPLRMLRCLRFASRFGFRIDDETYNAIKICHERIQIITKERIVEELNKMLMSDNPRSAFWWLHDTELLKYIIPELDALCIVNETGHKDIFDHTLSVLNHVAKMTDDLWTRWAALLHDVGKVECRRHDNNTGKWSFTNHEMIGGKMVGDIFKKIGLPLDQRMEKVRKLVTMHMRPMTLCENGVTDSAVRRILFDAGDDIDDLIILCKADITTKYSEKRERIWKEYDELVKRIHEVEEKDHLRNFQPPVDGNEIMEMFGLTPSHEVGELKKVLKEAVLDGLVGNNHDEAVEFLKDYWGKKKEKENG